MKFPIKLIFLHEIEEKFGSTIKNKCSRLDERGRVARLGDANETDEYAVEPETKETELATVMRAAAAAVLNLIIAEATEDDVVVTDKV